MEKETFNKILTAAMALALVACQGSDPLKRESNPVKNYSDVTEKAVPYQDQSARTQFYSGEAFEFGVVNDKKQKYVFNFVQGTSKTFTVNFRMLVDKVTYKANLELPEELKDKGIQWIQSGPSWTLSWTPARGTIPATKGSLTFNAKIVLVATTNDEKAKKLLANKDLSTPVEITVQRPEIEPTIKISGLNEKTIYKADKTVPFTLVVADPAMSQETDPAIKFSGPIGGLTEEQITRKGYVKSSTSFTLVSAVNLGNGTWNLGYEFVPSSFLSEVDRARIDLTKLPDVITVVSSVSAISYGQSSPDISIVFQIENPRKTKVAAQGDKK